jgi:hypothetical protein
MTTTQNGHDQNPNPSLLPVRQLDQPGVAGLAAADAQVPVAPVHPPNPGLAEVSRRERAGRKMHMLTVAADFLMKTRVRHPDGGESSVAEVLEHEQAQRNLIQQQAAEGSAKHRRAPRWIHWIPRLVLCFDFALLLYFFAGITNVDWSSPLSMAMAFATVLAAMVTVLSYGYLAFTGHRLRGHKDHTGTVHRDDLDGFTRIITGVAVVVIFVIAALMFLRMHTEVLYALGLQAGLTALLIASGLAIVSAAANFLVVAIHALDGSDDVARLEKLSAAARRPYAKAQRMRQRAAYHAGPD